MSMRVQGPREICKELPYWARRVLKVGLSTGPGGWEGGLFKRSRAHPCVLSPITHQSVHGPRWPLALTTCLPRLPAFLLQAPWQTPNFLSVSPDSSSSERGEYGGLSE